MESKTNQGMKEVLKMAAKDPAVRGMLAKALLAAKSEEEVADAFSNVKLNVLKQQQGETGQVDQEAVIMAEVEAAESKAMN